MKEQKTYPPISAFSSSIGKKVDRDLFLDEFFQVSENFVSLNETLNFFGIDIITFYGELDEDEKDTIRGHLHVSPLIYYEEKKIFDENMKNGSFSSFLCVLKKYNLQDCIVLYKGLKNFEKTLSECFNVDLFQKISLPSLSEHILWSMIDTSQGHISSVGQNHGHINQKIRSHLLGGPCIPFFRHIELGPIGDYPDCVYFTPSGERFTTVTSFDFNGIF